MNTFSRLLAILTIFLISVLVMPLHSEETEKDSFTGPDLSREKQFPSFYKLKGTVTITNYGFQTETNTYDVEMMMDDEQILYLLDTGKNKIMLPSGRYTWMDIFYTGRKTNAMNFFQIYNATPEFLSDNLKGWFNALTDEHITEKNLLEDDKIQFIFEIPRGDAIDRKIELEIIDGLPDLFLLTIHYNQTNFNYAEKVEFIERHPEDPRVPTIIKSTIYPYQYGELTPSHSWEFSISHVEKLPESFSVIDEFESQKRGMKPLIVEYNISSFNILPEHFITNLITRVTLPIFLILGGILSLVISWKLLHWSRLSPGSLYYPD